MKWAEWMKGIWHGLGTDVSLHHSMATGIRNLAHLSDHWTSGSCTATVLSLSVLQLFDLTQHVSHSTHKYGNSLDLITTRANDDVVGKWFVHDPLISDYLAVHVSLRLAKLLPERRTMSYRRIRAIDFHEFCRDLENSSLVRDAETSDLSDFVNKYNNILKSLLDTNAPLRTRTITLRPTASWYKEEIRSEKRRRRALERRWRSSKLECDRLRF